MIKNREDYLKNKLNLKNKNLNKAKKSKNDEFYTLYEDIEKEIEVYYKFDEDVFKDKVILLPCDDPEQSNFTRYFIDNFERFKIKKLISSSYAIGSEDYLTPRQFSLFEDNPPLPELSEDRREIRGKIFLVTREEVQQKGLKFGELEINLLEGTGDFRSREVSALRDEADIIITNPPFSLFREFVDWLEEAEKEYIIIGNMNAITYKNVFPLIRDNKLWLGSRGVQSFTFRIPDNYYVVNEKMERDGKKYAVFSFVSWFTNIKYKFTSELLDLKTMEENLKISGIENLYKEYDNYNAIEVPSVNLIPSDYSGVMGVPINFLEKYNSEQFEIMGSNRGVDQDPKGVYGRSCYINGVEPYKRIFIRHKKV